MTFAEGYSLALEKVEAPTAQAPAQALAQPSLPALVQTHASTLFRVAHSTLRSRSEAEDVVQEVFLRILQRPHALAEIRDLRVWLIRIAWNLAIDRRRRIRPQQIDARFAESLIAPTIPADRALGDAQRMNAVLQELERLPTAERHVLLLTAVDELDTREIAAVLERSESAVRALLSRARTRLRERLQKHEHLDRKEKP